ncbi:cadherin-like beta sandwich domain-containing protein [Heyndrickxia coagulans]|uniref:Cadherin-like beta sandwich domain-containing protein n=1 Tax=Heyndrickxia coagulans TaxID=1398 RepID=A0AAW7CAF4_HEYCO|nr:cadherin-like beta sandwich domain-containing protein [Heyndrickxia coagulans]MDL5039932.1 cadherin-like beta sandwich domain-containing protein [Heyndrickxia coagulans]
MSPAFQSSKTSYNVTVPNSTSVLKITPKVKDSTASVKVNGIMYKSKAVSVKLPVEKTTISIIVTAENGEAKTYTLHVTRKDDEKPLNQGKQTGGTKAELPGSTSKQPGTKNTGASKQAGAGSEGIVKQGALAGKTASGMSEAWNQTSGGNSMASQALNKTAAGTAFKMAAAFSGKNSSLSAGTTAMKTSAAVSVKNMGTKGSTAAVSKATLSSLTVSKGTWNKDFSKNEYTYHIKLATSLESVTITATPTYSGSTVSIRDSSAGKISIGKNEAEKVVSVVVTNGSERKTYVLVFKKKVTGTSTTVSDTGSTSARQADDASSSGTAQTRTAATAAFQTQQQQPSWWSKFVSSIESFFKSLFSFN